MIDKLQAFRGIDYAINSKIVIRQPTLQEICDYGEQKYLLLIKMICSTPADHKVEIWDAMHIYWDQMDEYELFSISIIGVLQRLDVSILFKGIDFSTFHASPINGSNEIRLCNKDGIIIDRSIYSLITDYLRYIHHFKKNDDVGYNDLTKDIMIEDDRDEQTLMKSKQFDSVLLPLISSLTNCSDFKYRYDDVWTMPIGAFMDSVGRIQKFHNYEHMMQGIYSGCVDMKKINKRDLNWMGELK